jgi:heat shock protein HtpX
MGLRLRMSIAIAALFALVFAALIFVYALLTLMGVVSGALILILPFVISVAVVLLQWGLGPYILKWVYHIRWIDLDTELPTLAPFIRRVCAENNIKVPRAGVIDDGNPNAFVFGHTKNHANLVITRGVFQYCNTEEQVAVVGHELGHLVHNDFVVMTVISVIPLLFFSLYIGARVMARAASRSRGRSSGQAAAIALAVAVIAWLIYFLSQLIVLLVSRYRESWADDFSARTTKRPSLLASALVKIAYGLTVQNRGSGAESKGVRRFENALMFASPRNARSFVAATSGSEGEVDRALVKKTMSWDLWNPWAKLVQLQMSHPLPAYRIRALGKLSREFGEEPYVEFDLKKPEFFIDDFLEDLAAKHAWWIVGLGLVGAAFFTGSRIFLPLALTLAGVIALLYFTLYHYPMRFKSATVAECLSDPKAGPVKGKPVVLEGVIIGRGTPGLVYSEDLKLQDATGLMFLDYNQVLRIINFFVGLLGTQQLVGLPVRVTGWYRRYSIPYVDVYKLEFANRTKTTYNLLVRLILAGAVAAIGALWLFLWL